MTQKEKIKLKIINNLSLTHKFKEIVFGRMYLVLLKNKALNLNNKRIT
jgi:hypothetical protein